eukprot:4752968-Ditylum_brightwellii.AAC.1
MKTPTGIASKTVDQWQLVKITYLIVWLSLLKTEKFRLSSLQAFNICNLTSRPVTSCPIMSHHVASCHVHHVRHGMFD